MQNMETELKSKFDVIVLGTGFIESLIAAASARVGKRVLHLDRNGFYGGQWASFSLSSLEEWVENVKEAKETSDKFSYELTNGEALCALSSPSSIYSGVKCEWHVPESVESSEDQACEATPAEGGSEEGSTSVEKTKEDNEKKKKVWSRTEVEKTNRKFNVDLAPKILFSRGALVELLISSNVARYVEFKCITRVLTWVDEEEEGTDKMGKGKLLNVPCSRSNVFTTDVINLVEKRLLMKFLEFCYTYEQKKEDWSEYVEKPFTEFLASRKLTPKLIHFITSAIGMVEDDVSCEEGLRKTSLFLNSLGRYGTMPFLYSLYGSGEMPQAFCRLCAVFEGIYILRKEVDHLKVNGDGGFVGVTSEGSEFEGGCVVMDAAYAPKAVKDGAQRKQSVSRGIFVTDCSILADEKEQLTILRMPSTDKKFTTVTVIEVGSGCAVCPKDTFLVHLVCGGEDAETDLKTTVERLFRNPDTPDEDKPNVLFSAYFNQMIYDIEKSDLSGLPSNVHLCSGPDASLDYDEAILQAKKIFGKIFPDEEFLPKAPDHNEIVFDDPKSEEEGGDEKKEEGEKKEEEKKEENEN